MMKQKWLLLTAFFPWLISWLYNITILPLNGLLLYPLPLVAVGVWVWVGWRYAHSGLRLGWSFLGAHWLVLVSLPVYIWQFWFVSDAARSMALAGFGQCTAIFSVIVARLAVRFEPDPTSIGLVSTTAMQVLGVLLFALLFLAGYAAGKYSKRKRERAE